MAVRCSVIYLQDVLVVRLEAAKEEDKPHYTQMFSYLSGRHRCGVVGHLGKIIKDMYIVPLASKTKIPSFLLSFNGPGKPATSCIELI